MRLLVNRKSFHGEYRPNKSLRNSRASEKYHSQHCGTSRQRSGLLVYCFPVVFFFFFYEGEWITSVWALNKAACSKTDVVCCTLAERMSSLFTVEPGANFF